MTPTKTAQDHEARRKARNARLAREREEDAEWHAAVREACRPREGDGIEQAAAALEAEALKPRQAPHRHALLLMANHLRISPTA